MLLLISCLEVSVWPTYGDAGSSTCRRAAWNFLLLLRTCLVAAAVSGEEATRAVYTHEAAVGRYWGEKKESRCCRVAEFSKTHQMKACKMAAVQETVR